MGPQTYVCRRRLFLALSFDPPSVGEMSLFQRASSHERKECFCRFLYACGMSSYVRAFGILGTPTDVSRLVLSFQDLIGHLFSWFLFSQTSYLFFSRHRLRILPSNNTTRSCSFPAPDSRRRLPSNQKRRRFPMPFPTQGKRRRTNNEIQTQKGRRARRRQFRPAENSQ